MNKSVLSILICSVVLYSSYDFFGSTTSVVTLVGGIIKAKHIDKEKKYPRKDCPICKGTGKYLSGDKIKMVDCGYCEPDVKDLLPAEQPVCTGTNCKTKVIKK